MIVLSGVQAGTGQLQRYRCTLYSVIAVEVANRDVRRRRDLWKTEVKAMAFKNGTRLPVSMAQVFPAGCHLVPDSIAEAQDYDEQTKRRTPSVDKVTGKRVFQCRVVDMDPDLEGRSRETAVKILADRMPAPPTRAPFELVEFDGLQVTPYVTDRGRMAYSLRSTAIKAARPVVSKDAA